VFARSQSFVSDELKRRYALTHATFVDFLEALGRLCTFVHMPTQAVLEEYGAKSAKDFYDQVSAGAHLGTVLAKRRSTAASTGGEEWLDEEQCTDSLVAPIGMLISLMLDRLDESSNMRVDRTDAFLRRKSSTDALFLARQSSWKDARSASWKGGIERGAIQDS